MCGALLPTLYLHGAVFTHRTYINSFDVHLLQTQIYSYRSNHNAECVYYTETEIFTCISLNIRPVKKCSK